MSKRLKILGREYEVKSSFLASDMEEMAEYEDYKVKERVDFFCPILDMAAALNIGDKLFWGRKKNKKNIQLVEQVVEFLERKLFWSKRVLWGVRDELQFLSQHL